MVSGIYRLTPDAEKKYVYVPLAQWQQLLGKDRKSVSFIDLRVDDEKNIDRIKNRLQEQLGPAFQVKDKLELNRGLLKMLNLENAFTYFTGLLFLIIAVFNIVGSIIILILKKKKDRFVLSALGMDLGQIKKIFFYYGNLLILGSGLAGLILGSIFVGLQQKYGFINVPGTYMTYPVEMKLSNYLIVIGSLLLVGLISSHLATRAVKEIREKM